MPNIGDRVKLKLDFNDQFQLKKTIAPGFEPDFTNLQGVIIEGPIYIDREGNPIKTDRSIPSWKVKIDPNQLEPGPVIVTCTWNTLEKIGEEAKELLTATENWRRLLDEDE